MSRNKDAKAEVADDKETEMGCGFVDLCPIWKQLHQSRQHSSSVNAATKIYLYDNVKEFDQHGDLDDSSNAKREGLEIQLRISAEVVSADDLPKKRLLLYKHGDDLRQELLAIQFIERCSQILMASGLDLKLKTFRCLPVGAQKGFIEWVSGTVPLSELCHSSGSSNPVSNAGSRQSSWSRDGPNLDDTIDSSPPPVEVVDEDGFRSQRRSWCKYHSLRGLRQKSNGLIIDNPIQDFLRSAAYDEDAPFFVKKDVMDNYVKSCAGYCVITYLLVRSLCLRGIVVFFSINSQLNFFATTRFIQGVGDRHLDNILLHQNGHLLHCDYSFILGHDPKTYLPMRYVQNPAGWCHSTLECSTH